MRTLKYRDGNDISLMRETKAKLVDLIFDYDIRLSLFASHKDSMKENAKRMREMINNYARYKVYEQVAVPEGEEHTYVTQDIWHAKLIELANAKHEISQLNGQIMQLVDERDNARRTIEERNATLLNLRNDIVSLEASKAYLHSTMSTMQLEMLNTKTLANQSYVDIAKFQQDRFHTWHTRILTSFCGKVFLLFNSDLLATKEHNETIPTRDA